MIDSLLDAIFLYQYLQCVIIVTVRKSDVQPPVTDNDGVMRVDDVHSKGLLTPVSLFTHYRPGRFE